MHNYAYDPTQNSMPSRQHFDNHSEESSAHSFGGFERSGDAHQQTLQNTSGVSVQQQLRVLQMMSLLKL